MPAIRRKERNRNPAPGNSDHLRQRKQASRNTSQRVRYRSLQDPENQIRLLKITENLSPQLPDKQCTSTDLSFELSTWNIKDAPAYYAISYAWGDLSTESLTVNGEITDVRSNCHYALLQTTQYQRAMQRDYKSYIWIDSICINQASHLEKGHQVKIMWKIYQGASKVLACVGPANDADAGLENLAIDVLERIPRSLGGLSNAFRNDIWPQCLDEFVKSRGERLLWAFRSFSLRPYWSRLWVVQELAASLISNADSEMPLSWGAEVLFGNAHISFNSLYRVLNLLQNIHRRYVFRTASRSLGFFHAFRVSFGPLARHFRLPHEESEEFFQDVDDPQYDRKLHTPLSAVSLADMLELYQCFECADPRDRIFGLLRCGNVPEPLAQVMPDYTLSNWDLAMLLSPYMRLKDLALMFKVLDVDAHHPRLRALVREKTNSTSSEVEYRRFDTIYSARSKQMLHCLVSVHNDTEDPPTTDIVEQNGKELETRSEHETSADVPSAWEHRLVEATPACKIIESLVPPETRTGDFLYEVCDHTKHGWNFALVLRPLHKDTAGRYFEMVGHGVIKGEAQRWRATERLTKDPLRDEIEEFMRHLKRDAPVLLGNDPFEEQT